MRILLFDVNGQSLTANKNSDFSGIVKGSKGYLKARFNLSKEWNGCKIAASFFKLGQEYPAIVKNGVCDIPDEALTWNSFKVQLLGMRPGGYKIQTNKLEVKQEG